MLVLLDSPLKRDADANQNNWHAAIAKSCLKRVCNSLGNFETRRELSVGGRVTLAPFPSSAVWLPSLIQLERGIWASSSLGCKRKENE
jgi:hypothetical protein